MDLGCCVSLQEMVYAEKAGFDFLELQVGSLLPELDDKQFQKVQDIIENSVLPVKSFNAFLPPHIPIVGPEVNWEKSEKFVLNALERMKKLGGEQVSFGSGFSRSCPPDFPRERAKEQIIQFIENTAIIAQSYDIKINIESLNHTECNMINSLLVAKEYADKINLPNVSILADFYHIQMENEPLDHLKQIKYLLKYVHVADTGRLYPGSGHFPFASLISILRDIEYDGPISVECTWIEAEKEIQRAANFLKTLLGVKRIGKHSKY
jgi:sugar phosphate isomerase/epimerase